MNVLLRPVISLMQRLRLLPKFSLIALLFVAPLLLVMFFLFSELQKSIQIAEQERHGARYVLAAGNAIRLSQQHRALHYMQLSGNAAAAAHASQAFDALKQKMDRLERYRPALMQLGAGNAWEEALQAWKSLQDQRPATNAKDSYAAHTALIDKMSRLNALVADRSGLALDPEVASNHLATTIVSVLPEIADGLSHIAGRGGAYIDTGLMEANEDVILNSRVMVARYALQRLPARFETVFRENPALQPRLEQQLAAMMASQVFLDRARDEVLMAYNQTSGLEFFEAGSKSIDGLYAVAAASAEAIDILLAQRIEHARQRLALVAAVVLTALAIAAYLLAGFYLSFSREIGKLEDAVERAAAGDLTVRIESQASDEVGRLVNAFGDMNAGLARLVAQVRVGSEAVTETSLGIAAGNANLSSRTESQASALEETASAMEELTATVKQNRDHAVEANQLAVAAAEVASRGSSTVAQAVDTMGEIKASSRKIIDIIGVIDTLAFQTNMLALNAAVEAARAGEHGRGFAVVAGEVRALAQRSASASKEIKFLIESSLGKIDDGNRLVNTAGATMGDIVSSVGHVASLINDIASASREQTAGIEQVSQAIIQLDDVTQRNATLVEDGANAANSLQTQALRLQHAVSVFKLDSAPIEEQIESSRLASVTPLPAPRQRPHATPLPVATARLEMKKSA